MVRLGEIDFVALTDGGVVQVSLAVCVHEVRLRLYRMVCAIPRDMQDTTTVLI